MCKVGRIYIPDKHRAFWNERYKTILWNCGHDDTVFHYIMKIT